MSNPQGEMAELAALTADVSANMTAERAEMAAARADMGRLTEVTAQCLATAEHALAEIQAMNAEAERLG